MLFRDVIVHCDQWDVDQNKYVNTKRQAKKLPISDQWIQEANIHRDGYDSICRSLSWKVDVVMAMPHLRSFTVDARWLCFPMCCCRIAMLRTLVKLIVAQWGTILVRPKTAMPSWRVIFVGIYDQAEEAEIRRLDKVDPPVPWELSVKA